MSAAPPPPLRQIPSWPGWLCLIPAVLLLLFQLVIPSFRVLIAGFTGGEFGQPAEFVGLRNYQQLFAAGSGEWVPTVIASLLIFIVALIIAAAIGALGGRAKGWPAVLIRIGLGALLVCYAPASMALLLIRSPFAAEPPGSYLIMLTLYVPMVAAGSAVIALATFADGVGSGMLAAGVLAAFGLLAAIAWALQVLEPSLTLGPRAIGRSPAATSWELGLIRFDLGTAHAQNTIVLIVLGVLGLIATLLILVTGLRVDVEPVTSTGAADRGTVSLPALLGIAVTGLVLLIAVILDRTWVAGLVQLKSELIEQLGLDRVIRAILNTWAPPLLATVPQVVTALLAGLAIGFFQPLGPRFSRWIVLLFAPWLFTGIAPLLMIYYMDLRAVLSIDLWINLVPRIWVVGPAIILFSLLFAGVRRQREHTGSYASSVWPVVGSALLATVVLLMVQSQALGWNLVIAANPDLMNASALLFQMAHQVFGDADGMLTWLSFPLPILLILGAVAAASMIMIGRLRIRTGRI